MGTEQCSGCKFWLAVPDPTDCPVDGISFGWCRREPPRIVDHMARIALGTPGFGGNIVDPEQIAGASSVHNACLHPATYRTDWCGRFSGAQTEGR